MSLPVTLAEHRCDASIRARQPQPCSKQSCSPYFCAPLCSRAPRQLLAFLPALIRAQHKHPTSSQCRDVPIPYPCTLQLALQSCHIPTSVDLSNGPTMGSVPPWAVDAQIPSAAPESRPCTEQASPRMGIFYGDNFIKMFTTMQILTSSFNQ